MNNKDQNDLNHKPKKRIRKDLHPKIRIQLGSVLKNERQDKNFSLNDIALMTDMSKAMAWSVEMGIAKGLDFYIEYANAVSIALFPHLQYEVKPRYALPEKNRKRIFLTARIKELREEEKLFEAETTVGDIIDLLGAKKGISNSKGLSTKIAGILRNWVEEDGILTKTKKGNINIYKAKE